MDGSVFGKRAGLALDALIPEKNRDKVIARMFGVTTRMARYLRAGQCWTVERLSLASTILGTEFNELLVPRDQPLVPSADCEVTIAARLERIETSLNELLAESRRLRGKQDEKSARHFGLSVRVVR
jgi:hypothetical protein